MRPRSARTRALLRIGALAVFLALSSFGSSSVVAETTRAEESRSWPQSFAKKLDAALSSAGVPAARQAAVVIDLRSGETLFSRNARAGLAPASNEKLPVAYAATVLLGAGYRIPTDVLGEGERAGSVWEGDVYLKGYGDPDLSKYDLVALAKRLRATGIRSISGDLVGDESAFDRRRMVPGWKSGYYIEECAPLSALSINRGRDTSASPPMVAVRRFAEALEAAGVKVRGKTRLGFTWEEATPLVSVKSPPLWQLLRFMNRESDNYTAELLLKQIGLSEYEYGSSVNGAALVTETLAEAEIPLSGVRIVDGSGLSRLDRLSATALGALLSQAWNDPAVHATFVSSLAVAGRNGTLSRRLRKPPALGNVRAKTGTTLVSSALAGYVRDRFAFVIIQNGSPVPSERARAAQDRFVTLLAARSR